MLYRLQEGNFVVMMGADGLEMFQKAWKQAMLEWCSNHSYTVEGRDSIEPIAVPENAATVVLKNMKERMSNP